MFFPWNWKLDVISNCALFLFSKNLLYIETHLSSNQRKQVTELAFSKRREGVHLDSNKPCVYVDSLKLMTVFTKLSEMKDNKNLYQMKDDFIIWNAYSQQSNTLLQNFVKWLRTCRVMVWKLYLVAGFPLSFPHRNLKQVPQNIKQTRVKSCG